MRNRILHVQWIKQRAVKSIITFLPVLLYLISMPSLIRAAAPVDTVRILALRVEFVADNLATTTGDGTFDLSSTSKNTIDRSPHNRTYFQHQLLALNNYFQRVSRGKMVFSSVVLPAEETRAYKLGQNMVYYSGQEDKKLQKQRWAEMLRDALLVAEKEGSINFSAYDCVVVFHAGVGNDFAFDFDSTPYDIQSVYLDLETLQQTLGGSQSGYKGIAVGGTFIRNGLILPETQNQEGANLALLGTMTLLMGSHLGMPVLFESESGRTGIGRWGLMDQGSYNFQGLIPAEPSAWEKVHMGWEEPVLVRQGEVRIGSSTTKLAPHIIKVPIDEKEYFLIENRVRDRNRDKITIGRDENGHKVEFDSTGRLVASGELGVLTRIDEYDFGLPGNGLLIWHIDERVIDSRLASNSINNERTHRGVDLVECDGAQDIGYIYDMFDAGYGTENGDYYDAYWNDNESHKIVNSSNQVTFSPLSIPNSDANNGAVTHITLDQFSRCDTVMTVRIRSDLAQPGFPLPLTGNIGKAGMVAMDLGTDIGTLIAAASRDGRIQAWRGNGQPLLTNGSTLFATTVDSIIRPIAAAPASEYGPARIVATDRSGNLYAWLQKSESEWVPLRWDSLSTVTAGPTILTDPSSRTVYVLTGHSSGGTLTTFSYSINGYSGGTEGHIRGTGFGVPGASGAFTGFAQLAENGSTFLYATETGLVACFSTTLTLQWQKQLSAGLHHWQPIVADFTEAAGLEIAVLSEAGECWLLDSQGSGARIANWSTSISDPSAGDVDGDGLAEILFTAGNQLFAYEPTGATTLNFPFSLGPQSGSQPLAPLWLETVSTPKSLTFASGAIGLIWGVTPAGRSQSGYPLNAGGELQTTPIIQDLDRDGDVELLVAGQDELLYAWSLPASMQKQSWTQWGANSSRTFHLASRNLVVQPGQEILPVKKTFCYPNPTQGQSTNIRYTLTQAVDKVSIGIFDMTGELVQELAAPSTAIGDHDMTWSIASIQSGVYIARVEAQAADKNSVVFIKIAVVK
jgi:M6 family metalloprotease-like protein